MYGESGLTDRPLFYYVEIQLFMVLILRSPFPKPHLPY
jgi:hypothetical protein